MREEDRTFAIVLGLVLGGVSGGFLIYLLGLEVFTALFTFVWANNLGQDARRFK
jgi:hypothetical protein